MLTVCPQCKKSLVVPEAGVNRCKHCKSVVYLAEPGSHETDRVIATAEEVQEDAERQNQRFTQSQSEPVEIPWEQGKPVNYWQAFWSTWMRSVFSPTRFFSSLNPKGKGTRGFAFGWLVVTVSLLVHFGMIVAFFSLATEQQYQELMTSLQEINAQAAQIGRADQLMISKLMLLFTPLFAAGYLFISAGLSHSVLKFLEIGEDRFQLTLKAVGYAAGPMLFFLLPSTGAMIALPWTAWLTMLSITKLHGIDSSKAVLVVGLPFMVMTFGMMMILGLGM